MHPKHYHIWRIPKSNGGVRQIEEPHEWLKQEQEKLHHSKLKHIPVSDHAHAFVEGRGPITNAKVHAGNPHFMQFDIKDFFPKTTKPMLIYGLYMCGFSVEEADEIAQICCFGNRLPQGGPTSPVLANIACKRLDLRLAGLAEKWGATYSRYADDLTFSFDHGKDIYPLRFPVERIINEEGYRLRRDKTRILRPGMQRRATGIICHEDGTVAVPRKFRRRLRAKIHQFKLGINDTDTYEQLVGMAAWVYGADPEQGEKFFRELRECAPRETDTVEAT